MSEPKPRWARLGLLIGTILTAWLPTSVQAAPVPDSHGCIGRWAGTGRNSGFDTEWTIDLTLASAPSGGRCGTIEYTNPACGGTLEHCELVGSEIHTQEDYTHNDGSCAPPGRVIIRCNGDTLSYSWIGWERVNSTLHRVGGAPSSGTPPATPPTPGSTPAPANPGSTENGEPSPTPPPADTTSPTPAPTGSRERGLLDKIGCSALTGALHATFVLPWLFLGRFRRRMEARPR